MKSNKNSGRCYELNFKYCTCNEGWLLVHGNCINPKNGIKQGHAWCEKEVQLNVNNTEVKLLMVYDAVSETEIPKDAYYYFGKCEAIEKYTAQQAIDMVLKYKHFGYWEHEDQMGITK